jgi:hypothetical protein
MCEPFNTNDKEVENTKQKKQQQQQQSACNPHLLLILHFPNMRRKRNLPNLPNLFKKIFWFKISIFRKCGNSGICIMSGICRFYRIYLRKKLKLLSNTLDKGIKITKQKQQQQQQQQSACYPHLLQILHFPHMRTTFVFVFHLPSPKSTFPIDHGE